MREPDVYAAWTAEIEAGGTLTVPPRTRRRWARLIGSVAGAILTGIGVGINTPPGDHGSWGTLVFYVGLAGLLVFIATAARTAYGLITGRPVLTINPLGIALNGRELSWTQVQRIELLPSSPTRRFLAIGRPRLRLSAVAPLRHIDVDHEHITDLESFRGWLSSQQNEVSRRRTADGS